MGSGLLTIGALACRGKFSVRTVRFWSDEGLSPVAKRSPKGCRRYGPEAVATLELVCALRELGVGLDAIAVVLAQSATPAEVAAAHVQAIDEQIRAQRAVLRVEERMRLHEQLETFTDQRVERYWELAGTLSGRPPSPKTVPAFRWLIDALRTSEGA